MPSGGGFAFGPYRLDARAKRLLRDDAEVPMPPRHFDLLHALVGQAGELVTKEALLASGWLDVAVSDNSLNQAISRLRHTLDDSDPTHYIATVARRGYRFVVPVATLANDSHQIDFDALLAPHRIWIDGRAALESLARAEIDRARITFRTWVTRHSNDAAFHVGFANACALQFESTRADLEPDRDALRLAAFHAREGCRLKPDWAEAWVTLGFVLERVGERVDALAALRRGVTLEPANWRHQLRLSYGSWGEERLHAARSTLALLPDCPLAHCLAATVYVARGALAEAEREIDCGLAALPSVGTTPGRFSAVALHWLKGLLCLARGADNEALAEFERELGLEPRGHMYGRECSANTWYAIGACRWWQGDHAAARAAFEEAIARVPRHPMALAMLGVVSGTPGVLGESEGHPVISARAALFIANGDAPGAVNLVRAALSEAPPGNAGWLLPIEPLLRVQRSPEVWTGALIELRNRAM